ncbi:MAG: RHS repeat-associated core domain-containing protein, partial [Nitrospirae bacterium]|nr:RHS repeat-associated core domain-containing protein [Fimbriimonadaceae bacterium]
GAYPLYDGHGNMIATLTKQPTNSFSLSARRYTDPWGVTRVGASNGEPDQRYCANLGHRQDDESGLTYMRARYYEPTTGRFVSEDPAMDGGNWFVYCGNQPVSRFDQSGRTWQDAALAVFQLSVVLGSAAGLLSGAFKSIWRTVGGALTLMSGLSFLATWFSLADHGSFGTSVGGGRFGRICEIAVLAAFAPVLALAMGIMAADVGFRFSWTAEIQGTVSAYCLTLALFMALDDLEQALQ